jgi:hypothetical protein
MEAISLQISFHRRGNLSLSHTYKHTHAHARSAAALEREASARQPAIDDGVGAVQARQGEVEALRERINTVADKVCPCVFVCASVCVCAHCARVWVCTC